MAKKYCVYKRVKDNIPGFRDWDETKIKCFDNKKEAKKLAIKLNAEEGQSVYHEGYGAGYGSIDTSFLVREEEEDKQDVPE